VNSLLPHAAPPRRAVDGALAAGPCPGPSDLGFAPRVARQPPLGACRVRTSQEAPCSKPWSASTMTAPCGGSRPRALAPSGSCSKRAQHIRGRDDLPGASDPRGHRRRAGERERLADDRTRLRQEPPVAERQSAPRDRPRPRRQGASYRVAFACHSLPIWCPQFAPRGFELAPNASFTSRVSFARAPSHSRSARPPKKTGMFTANHWTLEQSAIRLSA
jgi:hypothetical protein